MILHLPTEAKMAVKLVVLYPYPKDVEAFERAYVAEHVPLVADKVPGVTRYVLSRALGMSAGDLPFYLMAELYFPSLEIFGAIPPQIWQKLAEHATTISTGGAPISFVCTEETVN